MKCNFHQVRDTFSSNQFYVIMFVWFLRNIGYKHNLHLADVNYVCVKTVPDSTKMHQIKCKVNFFPKGARSQTSLIFLCAKHVDITLPPPPPCTLPLYLILPSLYQKPERNPDNVIVIYISFLLIVILATLATTVMIDKISTHKS